jgi:hypothetical protein
VSLFNGKDLAGWSVEYDEPKVWGVENGVIVGHGTDVQRLGYLVSDREYGDFVLRLEFNLDDHAASGVILRAVPGELLPHPFGNRLREHPVFMLEDQPTRSEVTGTLHWLLDRTHVGPNHPAELSPPGSWNRMEVEVKGHSLRASVNGKPVSDVTLGEGLLFKDGTVPALNRAKGRIGLLKSFRTARFRNIEIKELPPAVTDALRPGSVWKGTRSYRKGGWAGVTVTYEVHVRERDGMKFTGHKFDNGPNRNRLEVAGEVDGDTVTWHEGGGEWQMKGKLSGDTLRLTFRGDFGPGRMTEGDGELKRAGP